LNTFEILLFGISGAKLDPKHRRLIKCCAAVVAAERHQKLLTRIDIHRIAVTPLEEMIFELALALQEGDVAVLASGDPLFFGIGRILIERFSPERVRVFPALSAVQLACARFKIPWDDLPLLSLHGRAPELLAGRMLAAPRVLVFTDPQRSPDRLAADLLALLEEHQDRKRIRRLRIRVAENLSLPEERLWQGSLEEAARQTFAPLNIMLLEQNENDSDEEESASEPRANCVFGLQEHEISHSRGLITKDEIRAVILHRLRLPSQGVLWDVGGGSGSISVEAARLCPALSIYVVEQKEEGWRNIRANIVRYGLYNIRLVRGQAPDVFARLPDPDRVFIGGSRGLLAEIVAPCAQRLAEDGRLVVSAVLQNTAEQAPLLMAANGLEADVRTVSVTRQQQDYGEDGQLSVLQLNPITVITGKK
jgi:precorrin-6Y C5,15-methyltransferase (decarboxylating)